MLRSTGRRPAASLRSALTIFTPSLDRVFGTALSVATAFSYDGTEIFFYAYCKYHCLAASKPVGLISNGVLVVSTEDDLLRMLNVSSSLSQYFFKVTMPGFLLSQ